jgi:hypothetical protein
MSSIKVGNQGLQRSQPYEPSYLYIYIYYMPYRIVGETGGFRVCDQKKCFSKHPLTKKKAQKQRTGKPVGNYFV